MSFKRKTHEIKEGSLLNNAAFFLYSIARHTHFIIKFRGLCNKKTEPIDILFSSLLIYWRQYITLGNEHYDDFNMGMVMKEAQKLFKTTAIDIPSINKKHPLRPLKQTKDKFRNADNWMCIEEFIHLSDIFGAMSSYIFRRERKELKEVLTAFSESDSTRVTGFGTLLNLRVAGRMLKETKPRLVFMTCEFDQFNRALTYLAKKQGIPTIALQHGIITPEHPGYIFKNREIRKTLPDITCVYGPEYKKILVKYSIFKEEEVIVTGSPRYDVLSKAAEIYNRKRILEEIGADPEKKVILWTTQTHGLPENENLLNIEAVKEALMEMSSAQLIIKLHPGEEQSGKLYREYGLDAIIVPGEYDIYALIYAADIVLLKHSTTAIEAAIMKKPVIVMNLSGKPNPTDYVNGGIALGVYKKEELKKRIKELLDKPDILSQSRRHYLEKYLYHLDGMATERVVEIIKEKLKERSE